MPFPPYIFEKCTHALSNHTSPFYVFNQYVSCTYQMIYFAVETPPSPG